MDFAVETINLTKIFKKEKKKNGQGLVAVDHVNISVSRGEFFGLLGPNGAGKTTIIKMLCTIILPTEGTAKVNSYDILKDPYGVRNSFGWFHGETGGRSLYWRLSAEDNLRFYASLQNVPKEIAKKRIDSLLEFFGLINERKNLVKDFSTGMKVRVMLARAFLHNPPILFMDEPTIGLDTLSSVETRRLLKSLNKDLGKTIILTSHNMFEVEQLCERVAIMRKGRIIADDSPSRLRGILREVKTIEVELRIGINLQKILESLNSLRTVRKVTEVKTGVSSITLRLQVDDENEAISAVARKIMESKAEILAIRQAEPTLEDIFVKLTSKG